MEDPEASAMVSELEMNPETQVEGALLRAQLLKNQKRYEEAIDVLGGVLETSAAWFMFGEINWLLSNYSHALMAFLKGVHANPNNWQCLLYLGHYYRERGNDLDKARKCYQKALRINSNSEEAGAGLSTAYRLLKNSVIHSYFIILTGVATLQIGSSRSLHLIVGFNIASEWKHCSR